MGGGGNTRLIEPHETQKGKMEAQRLKGSNQE